MKRKKLFAIGLIATCLFSCQQDDTVSELKGSGYLIPNINNGIDIEGGRVSADTPVENFSLTIFNEDASIEVSYTDLSVAPDTFELEAGNYYATANSNNLQNAAFDNPFYHGSTDVFQLDVNEVKTVDINSEIQNTLVKVNYSDDMAGRFQSYSTTVRLRNTNDSLTYNEAETRIGYFIVEPLDIDVDLIYEYADGTTQELNYEAAIDNPIPNVLYNVNIDISPGDGQLLFNIIKDGVSDSIDIDLGGTGLSSQTWTRMYGGSETDAFYQSIELSNEDILIAGTSASDNSYLNNIGGIDFWLACLDKDGYLKWSNNYGTASSESKIRIAAYENHIYLSGREAGANTVYKLDLSGNEIWKNTFTSNDGVNDIMEDMIALSDNGFALTTSVSNHSGTSYIMKFDTDGNKIWETSLGGSGADNISALTETSDGGIAFAGRTESIDGDLSGNNGDPDDILHGNDIWIGKLDGSGNKIFSSNYGTAFGDEAYDIVETLGGDLFVAGFYQPSISRAVLIKVDQNGNEIFYNIQSENTTFIGTSLALRPDHSVLLATGASANGGDMLIYHLDNGGNLLWTKTYGGTGYESTRGIESTQSGDILVVGQSNSTDFDSNINNGILDGLILRLNPTGDL